MNTRPVTSLRSQLTALVAVGGFTLLSSIETHAAILYWDGTSTGLWTLNTNWSTAAGATTPDPGAAPGSGDDVVFNITGVNTAETITTGAAIAANSLTFNNTLSTTLQSSNSTARVLSLGSGGILVNSGAGAVNIGNTGATITTTLTGSQTWTNDSSSQLRLVNAVTSSATSTLTLAGSGSGTFLFSNSLNEGTGAPVTLVINSTGGTVTMGGGNYSGGTTVKSGTIISAGNYGTGDILLGDTTGSANATVIFNSGNTYANNLTVQSGSTGNTLTISNNAGGNTPILSGNLAIDKAVTFIAGTGSISLTGIGSGSGTVTIGSGTLQLGNGGTTGTLSTTGAIISNGIFGINRSNAVAQGVDFSGAALTGTGGFAQNGTGTTTLNAANTYTGATAVNNGTLVLDLSANNTGVIASTSTLTLGGNLVVKGKNTGASSQTLGNVTLSSSKAGSLTLDNNGGSGTTLTLGNTWTRSAGNGSVLNIDLASGGTLTSTPTTAANNNVLGFATVKTSGGTGFASLSGGNIVRLTGQAALLTTGNTATTNYLQTAAGSTHTLSGAQSVNSLEINTASASGTLDLGAGILTITSKGLLMTGTNNYTIQNGQLGANASELIIHQFGSGTLTINSLISNANSSSRLTTNGPGRIVLTGNNVYTGATSIQGGTLQVGDGGTTGTLGTGAVTNNASLVFNRSDATTVANVISGTGALTQAGTGTLKLSGASTFTGTATLNANTSVQAANTNALGTGVLVLNDGTTLSSDSATARALGNSSLTLNGNITLGDATNTGALTFSGGASGTGTRALNIASAVTINGVITDGGGALGLVKNGAGLLTLGGANTYTGTTTVNAGTLAIGGTAPGVTGATIVNTGATVSISSSGGGSGWANSDFTLNNGGALLLNSNGQSNFVRAKSITLNNGVIIQDLLNDVKENVGGALTSASGANVFTHSANGANKIHELTFDSFVRAEGSTLLVRGDREGAKSRLIFTTAPSGAQMVNNVLIGSFFGNSTAGDATDIASYRGGNVNTFTTTATAPSAGAFTGVATTNYKSTVASTVTGTQTGNSFNLGTGSSFNGTGTLGVTSGMILATDDSNIGGSTAGTLAFGAAEGIIYVNGLTGAGKTLTIGSAITGTNGLTFSGGVNGAGSLVLNGANTYGGNTTINPGTLTLGSTGSLVFTIGANGVNNSVGGTGTVNFNGSFNFDLTGANLTDGNSWTIVHVSTLTESFAGGFVVNGFTQNNDIWTNGAGFSFSEATGILSYSAVPEPSTFALLGGLGVLTLAGFRRRRS